MALRGAGDGVAEILGGVAGGGGEAVAGIGERVGGGIGAVADLVGGAFSGPSGAEREQQGQGGGDCEGQAAH